MDLGELVMAARRGRSFDELARLAGGVLTRTDLERLVGAPLRRFPDPDVLRGLARALGVGEAAVVLAAARSVGLACSTEGEPLAGLVPRAADLTEQQKTSLLQLLYVFSPGAAN